MTESVGGNKLSGKACAWALETPELRNWYACHLCDFRKSSAVILNFISTFVKEGWYLPALVM